MSQDTLRIATYNLLNYPGSDATTRNPHFRAVLRAMNPDVLVVQEMESSSGVTQFRDNVLNAGLPGVYSSAAFNDGPDTDNALLYKSSEVTFIGASYISNSPRQIAEYRIKPVGSSDTVRVYSLHLKANQEDSLTRQTEANTLRNYLNGLPSGTKFIVAGDFNIYRSTEPAFIRLTQSEGDNDGRCKDPLNAVGTWHANFAFRGIHTQSPRTRSFGNGTTGGMDDRFDMLLVSYPLDPQIILSSYTEYGNDGNHYNDSINEMPNSAVPDSVANGLHYASDHLPVYADFVFDSALPDTGFISIASTNWSSPATWSGGVVPTSTSNVTIASGTMVTIDGAVQCKILFVEGTLQFDATDGRSLTVTEDVTIKSGGEFRSSAAFTTGSTTDTLILGGSFENNGTFSPRITGSSSGTRVVQVTFNGSVPTTISGSTNPTNFSLIRMNLSSTAQTLTPLINVGFMGTTASALTLTRGTWVQSVGTTTTPNVNITVGVDAVLSLSDGGAFMTGSASLLVNGILSVAGGSLSVGGGNNRLEVLSGGSFSCSDGLVSILGRLTLSGGTTSITGGAMSVNPRGGTNLSQTSNVFEAASAAEVSMSGGSLTIVNPKTATSTGREVKVVTGSGAKTFSGGRLYFGDGVSSIPGSDSGFVVESGAILPMITLRTTGGTGRNVCLSSALSVRGLILESGALKLGTFSPGYDLTVAGDFVRTSGTIDIAGRTVTMNAPSPPGATSVDGSFVGANGFASLTVNNPSGITLNGNLDVSGTLNIIDGVVATGSNSITLASSAQLIEQAGEAVLGNISTTRTVTQAVNNTFGNIGVEINAADASPGATTVLRTTGVAHVQGFASSILRSFDITPAVNAGLNAQLRFHYDESELDGQLQSTLRLWRSEDDGSTWSDEGGVVDTVLGVVEVQSLDSLSLWTASDASNPLSLFSISVSLIGGWNMVSNPVTTPDDSVHDLFPGAAFPYAFAFSPTQGYQQQRRVLNGTGYWLKSSSGTVSIIGEARLSDSISISTGWNMIGTISVPVDTSAILQVPSGIRTSDFFEYNGAYITADTLFPGIAYWVKSNAPGVFVMPSPGPVLRSMKPFLGKQK